MGLLTKLKAKRALKHPAPEPKTPLHENLPKRLRQNAAGLEQAYGKTQFVERIRHAADRLEEMEMTITLIAQTTTDPAIKAIAQDAMDQWA